MRKFINIKFVLVHVSLLFGISLCYAQTSEFNFDEESTTLKEIFNGSTETKHFNNHYTITPPEGFILIEGEDARKFLVDLLDNPPQSADGVTACLVPDIDLDEVYYQGIPYFFVVNENMCGYVEDDDATSIDYSELLKEMKKDTKEYYDEYRKTNPDYPIVTLVGWAEPPYYDKNNHTLYWGKLLDFQHGQKTINYDMRILGKDGIVCLSAVGDEENLTELKNAGRQMLNNITFDKGYTYNDFDKSRDHIAEWTIGGLVAGKILTKVGFWAIIAKGWKFILIGLVAAGAAIKKFFFGRKEDESDTDSE